MRNETRRQRIAPWLTLFCLVGFGIFATAPPGAAKEGFGTLKKTTVKLQRVDPADVYVAGTRLDVRSLGSGKGGEVEKATLTKLESALLSGTRFELDERSPETLVEASVIQSDYAEAWERRSVMRPVRTGDGITLAPVNVRFKVVSFVFSLSYRVTDVLGARVLDADTIDVSVEEDYEEGKGAPSQAALMHVAIGRAVERLSARLVSTTETIGVLIPGGSLKDYRNLAEAGLWNQYLEALETRGESHDSESEAYRSYAMGLAYEALSYEALEPEISLSYLEEAASHYHRALQLHPAEKFFSVAYEGSGFAAGMKQTLNEMANRDKKVETKRAAAPIERVESAMEQYQLAMQYRDADAKAGVGRVASGRAKDLSASDSAMDNDAVIEMVRAGLAREIILSAVENAEFTAFDVSPQGLVGLARANVPSELIRHLQKVAKDQGRGGHR